MNRKTISLMILAATVVTGVSVGSAAYAEGEDGITAAGMEWQAANGDASVPADQWECRQPGAAGTALTRVRRCDRAGAKQQRPKLNSTPQPVGGQSSVRSVCCGA
jgi:hypothetical protein